MGHPHFRQLKRCWLHLKALIYYYRHVSDDDTADFTITPVTSLSSEPFLIDETGERQTCVKAVCNRIGGVRKRINTSKPLTKKGKGKLWRKNRKNALFYSDSDDEVDEVDEKEVNILLNGIITTIVDVEEILGNVIAKVIEDPKKYKRCRKVGAGSVEKKMKRSMEQHTILPGCVPPQPGSKKGCMKKCNKLISATRRQEINEFIWSMQKNEQSIWISHMIETIIPVRPRKLTSGKIERKFTQVFHLEGWDTRSKEKVCKKMFLRTLGLTCDKMIQTVLQKTRTTQLIEAQTC